MSGPDLDTSPAYDAGMAARSLALPQSANPHDAGTTAHTDWNRGWLTSEARAVEIALDGAPL